MTTVSESDKALTAAYSRWLEELKQLAPELLDSNSHFSNPYYISAPAQWYSEDKPRILIVGEEGNGEWGCGKQNNALSPDDFEAIQEYNRSYLAKQLGQIPMQGEKKNNSGFWRRVRAVSEYGVCAWTNIDKIHRLRKSRCKLSGKEREALHSTRTQVLKEEIEILKPALVVFFGWWGVSLKHELPELFEILYPNGLNRGWLGNLVRIDHNGLPFIFTYHPGWRTNKPANYENDVLKLIRESLERQ